MLFVDEEDGLEGFEEVVGAGGLEVLGADWVQATAYVQAFYLQLALHGALLGHALGFVVSLLFAIR